MSGRRRNSAFFPAVQGRHRSLERNDDTPNGPWQSIRLTSTFGRDTCGLNAAQEKLTSERIQDQTQHPNLINIMFNSFSVASAYFSSLLIVQPEADEQEHNPQSLNSEVYGNGMDNQT